MKFEDKINTVINADGIEELDSFPDESVHLILSDILYGIGVAVSSVKCNSGSVPKNN